ncbi:MAG: carboxypeptidase, partial [Actinomycetota bacterium]|nr:carboxypeptidase [Actinomycetota bacterium]
GSAPWRGPTCREPEHAINGKGDQADGEGTGQQLPLILLSEPLVDERAEAVYPGTVVTPYIQLGASDSRHFTRICDAVYRFTPFEISLEERGTLHAVNERIHVATWLRGIEFYEKLVAAL